MSWRVPAVAFSLDTTVKAGIATNAMKSVLNMSLSLSFFPVFCLVRSFSFLVLCVGLFRSVFDRQLLLFLFFSVSKHRIHATVFSRFKQIDKILQECVFLNCSSNATQTGSGKHRSRDSYIVLACLIIAVRLPSAGKSGMRQACSA